MLVQSATSSNFQPRASLVSREGSESTPVSPRWRTGWPGVSWPGKGQLSTRCHSPHYLDSRCRDACGGGSTTAIGRWLARGSAILWRSVDEQSVVPGRSRGTREFYGYVLLITLLVFVSRGLLNRSPLEVNNNQRVSSISSTSRYTINICTECVSREIRLFSRFFPYFTRSSLLYFYVFVLGRTVPFGHNPRLYVTVCSMCNQWEISRCSSSAPAFTSVPSSRLSPYSPAPLPLPPSDPHGCSRHLESTTATFMGASCAVKGSKSHPCHCCSHLASPGASVQQQQHHHHRHHHHHHETHHAHHQHHHHHHPAGKQPSAELQPQNNNGDCNILAPLRSKMKVLKKLKRKMGLGEPHPPLFSSVVFFFFFFFFFSFFFSTVLHRSLRSQPDLTCGHFSRVCGC